MATKTKSTSKVKDTKDKGTSKGGTPMASFAQALVKDGRVNDIPTGMKRVRATARRHFDALANADANVKRAKQHANDGNRWPVNVNADAARILRDALRLS